MTDFSLTDINDRIAKASTFIDDLKKGMNLPNYGGIPNDAFKELGSGMIDMEPIIEAAEKAGVAHCHVEQDHSPDAIKSIQKSIQYLGML